MNKVLHTTRNEELEAMQAILNIVEPLGNDYRARSCLRWCLEHIDMKQCASSGAELGLTSGMARQQFKS